MAAMAFHHVIATLGPGTQVRVLFTDLTSEELAKQFIRPYEQGKPFFAGHELISPHELRSIQIIRTQRPGRTERDEINRKDRDRIDRLNASGSGLVLISAGAGHEPEDIAEAGEDVTHTVIKGPPGFRANRWQPAAIAFRGVWGIVAAITSTVVAAGLIWWFRWR
jgi:hypothetical protein